MHYEINVSLNGVHFFATAERSIQDREKLEIVHSRFVQCFPVDQGFSISITQWNTEGRIIKM